MVAKVIVTLKIILTKDYDFTLEPKNGDLQTMTKRKIWMRCWFYNPKIFFGEKKEWKTCEIAFLEWTFCLINEL